MKKLLSLGIVILLSGCQLKLEVESNVKSKPNTLSISKPALQITKIENFNPNNEFVAEPPTDIQYFSYKNFLRTQHKIKNN